jgi:NAD(P)-dependent dehydrogenase (short-subunit alcohol dehydrogenase family)
MDRTVLVTGASRNIGRFLAQRYAADGYRVAMCARTGKAVEELAGEIRDRGGEAFAMEADVTKPDQVAALVEATEKRYGGVDILINNAVVRVTRKLDEMSFEEWRIALDVILDAAFLCTKAVVPGMRERKWGRVINMSGISAQRGAPDRIGVVTGKAGLIGFTRSAANATAKDGITVNVIAPSQIDTERGEWTTIGNVKETLENYAKGRTQIPVGRMGTLEEFYALVHFLTSDAAAFITGQTVSINGGRHMH